MTLPSVVSNPNTAITFAWDLAEHGTTEVEARFVAKGGFAHVFVMKTDAATTDEQTLNICRLAGVQPGDDVILRVSTKDADEVRAHERQVEDDEQRPHIRARIGPPPPAGVNDPRLVGAMMVTGSDGKVHLHEVFIGPKFDGSLEDFVQHNGPLDEQQAADFVASHAVAMAGLHQRAREQRADCPGFVHGDVKPANYLASKRPDGSLEIVLSDVNDTLRYAGDANSSRCTVAMCSYDDLVSPTASRTKDVRAFGATLYEVCSGRPFAAFDTAAGATPSEILEVLIEDPGVRTLRPPGTVVEENVDPMDWRERLIASCRADKTSCARNEDLLAIGYARASDTVRERLFTDEMIVALSNGIVNMDKGYTPQHSCDRIQAAHLLLERDRDRIPKSLVPEVERVAAKVDEPFPRAYQSRWMHGRIKAAEACKERIKEACERTSAIFVRQDLTAAVGRFRPNESQPFVPERDEILPGRSESFMGLDAEPEPVGPAGPKGPSR